ncbi:hypothetical protein EGW08_007589, partial [Elysia chlorotica]
MWFGRVRETECYVCTLLQSLIKTEKSRGQGLHIGFQPGLHNGLVFLGSSCTLLHSLIKTEKSRGQGLYIGFQPGLHNGLVFLGPGDVALNELQRLIESSLCSAEVFVGKEGL